MVSSSLFSWIDNVSGNPNELAFVPNIYSTFNQRMTFKERLTNVVMHHWLTTQMAYYTKPQSRKVKENFGIDLAHINELYNDVSLYLINSHHSLNGIRPMTTNMIEVAGLHLRDDDPLVPVCLKEN